MFTLTFNCNICQLEIFVPTTDSTEEKMDLNMGAASGFINIGASYYNFQELLTSMNIPCMSQSTFTRTQDIANDAWQEIATVCMTEAVK